MWKLIIIGLIGPLLASSAIAGEPIPRAGEKIISSGSGVRAEISFSPEATRQVEEKFILKGQVQVSFYDPAGFEIRDVKAAILNFRSSHAEAGQVVPLMAEGHGHYAADILLLKKGVLHLQVSLFLDSGEKQDFDFHYVI